MRKNRLVNLVIPHETMGSKELMMTLISHLPPNTEIMCGFTDIKEQTIRVYNPEFKEVPEASIIPKYIVPSNYQVNLDEFVDHDHIKFMEEMLKCGMQKEDDFFEREYLCEPAVSKTTSALVEEMMMIKDYEEKLKKAYRDTGKTKIEIVPAVPGEEGTLLTTPEGSWVYKDGKWEAIYTRDGIRGEAFSKVIIDEYPEIKGLDKGLNELYDKILKKEDCEHEWKEHVGLMERYEYCDLCNEKKETN